MNVYQLSEFQTDPNHRTDAVAVGKFNATAQRIQAAGAITSLGSGISLAVLWEKVGANPFNPILLETAQNSFALALNDIFPSQVVGWVESQGLRFAVMWEKTGTTILPKLGGPNAEAHGINNTGAVVGWSQDGSGQRTAFLWSAGNPAQIIGLGTLGGAQSEALDINDAGVIVGRAQILTGEWHACQWVPTTGGPPVIQDIHPSGFLVSVANAINGNGNVAGQAINQAGEQPFFLPTGGNHQFISTLGGNLASARALNDNDEVVGYSTTASSGELHGFYWKPGEIISDLDASLPSSTVWLFNRADGINADGYIVGTGRNADFRIRGAILKFLHPAPTLNPRIIDRAHLASSFIHIIAGVVAGSGGVGIRLGGGVVPIPPRPIDQVIAGTFANQDSLLLLLLSEVAQGIEEVELRQRVQQQLLKLSVEAIRQRLNSVNKPL